LPTFTDNLEITMAKQAQLDTAAQCNALLEDIKEKNSALYIY
jgi:hypothetical protein